jgi:hypothetical protein
MLEYKFNPKTSGSQIICCVPQKGRCSVGCSNCFFQPWDATKESRAAKYLGPNYEFTPNIPPLALTKNRIVRMNDVNDSNNKRGLVIATAEQFKDKFFNTSIPRDLAGFVYPVVLTDNPGSDEETNTKSHVIYPIPPNLMFVRARVATWNLPLIDRIVQHYSGFQVPIVLTFMAYYETPIPSTHSSFYSYRGRTLNEYWVINPEVWDMVVARYKTNPFVYTCGADATKFSCTDCRNCENLYKRKIKELGLPSDVV